MPSTSLVILLVVLGWPVSAAADETATPEVLTLGDVFQLEYASDPQISPDAKTVVYVRNFMDIMTDTRRSNLWSIDVATGEQRPLTTGSTNAGSPRWSPDGSRLAYVASDPTGQGAEIYLRYMDDGQTARLTQLDYGPRSVTWSPDGTWLAFSMFQPVTPEPFASLPPAPEGAEWAPPARVIETVTYRADGAGFLDQGHYSQLYVLPAEGGGTPRQLTEGAFDHQGRFAWSPDSSAILLSANRRDDAAYEVQDSDIWRVGLDRSIHRMTDRYGPDHSPALSRDGAHLAYLGYDDEHQGFQVTGLYVRPEEGGTPRLLTGALDRGVQGPVWHAAGDGLFFQYADRGNGKIGHVDLEGKLTVMAHDVGGTSLGRPYGGGSFSVADNGTLAYTVTRPGHPADVAVARPGEPAERLTHLNDDLFAFKTLGEVEELWSTSPHDGRKIQSWIVKPPGFDPEKRYPMVLEIHGGPFANYGDRFAAEVQLYAAAGHVVLYSNPRGSTSYGEAFANLIHHNYPSQDYDDLMSAVDAVIARGYVDDQRLFVTGGSGGGVLTSWIVGKTDRFRAAVVAKPVINWISFTLTADAYPFFARYWFPGPPWEHFEHYWKRSPLSLVGNVTTPTMLLTGEEDYRTPMSETEQYYQALKLQQIDTMMVRIPGASHGIAARPSQLMAKVAHVLAWFDRHDVTGDANPDVTE